MKLKSTTYYWLAVILGGVGMGAAMGAEGTAQTTGYISGALFAVSLVLILAAVLLARLGFAAEDREKAAKRRLGYKSANSFASSVYHCRKKKRKPHKYSFFQEVIKRDEVDSLPPIRRKKEEPARAPTRTSQKGDESCRPSPQKYHNVRQTARR